MKKHTILLVAALVTFLSISGLPLCQHIPSRTTVPDAEVTIVGAGPAGIIVAAKLLSYGIKDIYWLDKPNKDGHAFNVGRIGEYYTSVPANVKTKLFVEFITDEIFGFCPSPSIERLKTYDPEKEYPLHIIADPLKDITHCLLQDTRIRGRKTTLAGLDFIDGTWRITTSEECFSSRIVVLATGSHPKSLHYDCTKEISLDLALNKELLATLVTPHDIVAVIGSAHSAALVLKFLSEVNVAYIVHLYKRPFNYAVNTENCLQGIAADWVQNVLEKNPPHNLIQAHNTEEARNMWLPKVTKIIYASGFERNELPSINGNTDPVEYDPTNGTIAPGLFGIGIAFPEQYVSEFGTQEHAIGLLSFLEYAHVSVPHWVTKQNTRSFDDLITITAL